MKLLKLLIALLLFPTLIFAQTSSDKSEDPLIKVEGLEKGSKKEQLLQMINVKDVIIYDLDHHNDLVIAVGEDNSPRVRELGSFEPYYESIILRSEDGGKTWQKTGQSNSIPHEKVIILDEKRIVVSASYEGSGGYVFASTDGGHSWQNTYTEGMIESLEYIRNEIFVTDITGKISSSKDGGINWNEVSWSEMVNSLYEEYKEKPKETIKKDLIAKIIKHNREYKYNTSVSYCTALEKLVGEDDLPNSFNYTYAKSILNSNRAGYETKYIDIAIMKLNMYLKKASKEDELYTLAQDLLREANARKEENQVVE